MIQFPVSDWAYTTLIDSEDFDFLDRWLWSAQVHRNGNVYVVRKETVNKKTICYYMHREIVQYAGLKVEGLLVDHKDQNTLNNTRNNLRVATKSENGMNRGTQVNNTTGFKGVYLDKRKDTFYGQVQTLEGVKSTKTFSDRVEAAKAYDKLALQYFGPFAQLNFPELI